MNEAKNAANSVMPRFWKISHGKTGVMLNEDHDWLIKNNCVAIGYAPDSSDGKGQGKKFAGISRGDYFYLVRSKQVVLFGRFKSSTVEPVPAHLAHLAGWWMRRFEVIKNISGHPYPSSKINGNEAWKPTANTTVAPISGGHFTQFESTILKPAFHLSFADLLNPVTTDPMKPPPMPDWAPSAALNRILYGPPGTGKTFHTVTHALQIIDNAPLPQTETQVQENKGRFDQLRREGRIAFVTFHQSFSYEDFIEGIRAEAVNNGLSYEVKDGIFKKLAIAALFSKIQRKHAPADPQSREINFGDLFNAFREWLEENPGTTITSATGKTLVFQPPTSLDTLYVSHGASTKQHPAGRERLSKLYKKYPSINAMGSLKNKDVVEVIGGANTTAYWSVLKALLEFKEEHLDELKGVQQDAPPETAVEYHEKKARIREAETSDFGDGLPHVLIIDEINRGNTSRVFGELITLIEDTKRAGGDEQAEVTLPYSNDRFTVPNNLYLIGTMNTADRSLATIDTALRRRFDFIEMMPSPKMLEGRTMLGIDLARMLGTMNDRIEQLYDREHTIGHAFFMRLNAGSEVTELASIFNNKILPLLEEYFFEDWEKISRVLGNAEIYKLKNTTGLGFETSNKVYYRDTKTLTDPQTFIRIYALNAATGGTPDVLTNG